MIPFKVGKDEGEISAFDLDIILKESKIEDINDFKILVDRLIEKYDEDKREYQIASYLKGFLDKGDIIWLATESLTLL